MEESVSMTIWRATRRKDFQLAREILENCVPNGTQQYVTTSGEIFEAEGKKAESVSCALQALDLGRPGIVLILLALKLISGGDQKELAEALFERTKIEFPEVTTDALLKIAYSMYHEDNKVEVIASPAGEDVFSFGDFMPEMKRFLETYYSFQNGSFVLVR